jgi:ribulose-5-phosphate 4-epimerase/fuculose-1-phosphate aldolase
MFLRAARLLTLSAISVGSFSIASFSITPLRAQTAKEPSAADIQKIKEKVALATRMLTNEGIVASSGHVSMRIPGTDHIAVGPADVSRGIVTADDVVIVDLNSNQLEGKRKKPSETEIHTGIYRARPDVMAVVHTHPIYSVAFTVTGKPILPVTMHGAIFAEGVPVYDSVGHIDNRERGDGLAETLGKTSRRDDQDAWRGDGGGDARRSLRDGDPAGGKRAGASDCRIDGQGHAHDAGRRGALYPRIVWAVQHSKTLAVFSRQARADVEDEVAAIHKNVPKEPECRTFR